MRACYGPLQRVAGTAKVQDKGVDGWRPEFEGADALDAELSRPHFAMASADGTIYVADKDANAVRKIDALGKITTVVAAPEVAAPNGLWVQPDGTLFVLDLGHSAIKRVDTDGTISTLFVVVDGLSIGRGLWIDPDATLAYVASGDKVLRWSADAGVETIADGFAQLGNLIVDDGGNLVVTDRATGRVYRLDHSGTRVPIAGNGEASGGGDGMPAMQSALVGVRAISFDGSGGYFLGTHESSRVWYVDGSGVLQRFLTPSEVDEVRGLSLDASGNLLIVDHDGGRVWRLSRNGSPRLRNFRRAE